MKFKHTILLVSCITLFTACNDKKQDNQESTQQNSGKIEIVQSSNGLEQKVKEEINKDDRSYYYSYNKSTQSNEKTYTPIDANMRVRSPYEGIEISLMVKRLSKNFIVNCSACHNDYANGIIGPSLLGKSESFIYDSIHAFKTGKKQNVLMNDLVKNLSDEQIKELSEEIAAFNHEIQQMQKDKK